MPELDPYRHTAEGASPFGTPYTLAITVHVLSSSKTGIAPTPRRGHRSCQGSNC